MKYIPAYLTIGMFAFVVAGIAYVASARPSPAFAQERLQPALRVNLVPFEKICLQGTAYWLQREGLTTASIAVAYLDGKVELCSLSAAKP